MLNKKADIVPVKNDNPKAAQYLKLLHTYFILKKYNVMIEPIRGSI